MDKSAAHAGGGDARFTEFVRELAREHAGLERGVDGRWFFFGPEDYIRPEVRDIPGVHAASYDWLVVPDDVVPWLIRKYGLGPANIRGAGIEPVPGPTDENRLIARLPAAFERLYGFQRREIMFLSRKTGRMSASEMGVGKTPVALASACAIDPVRPWIVVCPALAKNVWADEALKWTGAQATILRGRGPEQWTKQRRRGDPLDPLADNPWLVVVNYDIAGDWADALLQLRPAGIICDEAHLLRGNRSQRGEKVRGRWVRVVREDGKIGFKRIRGFAEHIDWRIALTGTPIWNRPNGLWGIWHYLRPGEAGGYSTFTRRYCSGALNGRDAWATGETSNAEELRCRLEDVMVRNLKSDPEVAADLPPKTRQVVRLDMPTGQEIPFPSTVTEQTVGAGLRQAAPFKIGPAIEMTLEALDGGAGQLVIFTHLVEGARAIAAGLRAGNQQTDLPLDIYLATGSESPDERYRRAKLFNVSKRAVYVATMDAAGVAIPLHGASRVIFADLDYVPQKMLQAEDRVWRRGVSGPVLVTYLVMRGSVDDRVAEIVADKLSEHEKVLGDDVGAGDLRQKIALPSGADVLEDLRRVVEASDG